MEQQLTVEQHPTAEALEPQPGPPVLVVEHPLPGMVHRPEATLGAPKHQLVHPTTATPTTTQPQANGAALRTMLQRPASRPRLQVPTRPPLPATSLRRHQRPFTSRRRRPVSGTTQRLRLRITRRRITLLRRLLLVRPRRRQTGTTMMVRGMWIRGRVDGKSTVVR